MEPKIPLDPDERKMASFCTKLTEVKFKQNIPNRKAIAMKNGIKTNNVKSIAQEQMDSKEKWHQKL